LSDVLNIVLACVLGYAVFVATFFLLSKLLFPKIELDEEYEKLVETYQQKRMTARQRVTNRKIKPQYFKLSRSLKNRPSYLESVESL